MTNSTQYKELSDIHAMAHLLVQSTHRLMKQMEKDNPSPSSRKGLDQEVIKALAKRKVRRLRSFDKQNKK